MSAPSVVHDSFVLERTYPVSPARVFAAWADPKTKARWFIGPEGWRVVRRELDFRVGGEEVLEGVLPDGTVTFYQARYHDIVPGERLVLVYDMQIRGEPMSVSILTVEIQPSGGGASLRLTEQAAFVDGTDGIASRERGTAAHLDRIGEVLAGRR